MYRWIIAAEGKKRERVYHLPRHCPKCSSRDIVADVRDGWVYERCWSCDHNQRTRLLREEIENAARDVFEHGQ